MHLMQTSTALAPEEGGGFQVDAAVLTDADRIRELLEQSAPDTVPMPVHEVMFRIDEFEVVRHPRAGVVAAAAVRRIDRWSAELRGLVVAPEWRRWGLGIYLVRRAIARARLEALELVLATRRPDFFARQGFRPIPLEAIPEKPPRFVAETCERERVAMAYRVPAVSSPIQSLAGGLQ